MALGTGFAAPRGLEVPVSVAAKPLSTAVCSGAFIAHDLPHLTASRTQPAGASDGDGSGLALGDLDGDGLIDLVLANLNGPATILWNQGHFRFRKQVLDDPNTRAAAIVDVDGDGWPDLVFTHSVGVPSLWRNQGGKSFVQAELPGVRFKAYAMLWADLEGQGQLDLITASYDTLLDAELKNSFLFSEGAGVVLYRPSPRGYVPERLSPKSQGLAIAAMDVNGDGKPDLIVGNDFEQPDMVWQQEAGGWKAVQPFHRTSKNTMSLSLSDFDNDGVPELFSTDMKPDFRDLKRLAPWIPLMQKGYEHLTRTATQRPENMLQVRSGQGYRNAAYDLGLDATGWSWSAKFADLDNDGFQDLYVVNGAINQEIFGYLPKAELVEANAVFRNLGGRAFEPRPEWSLGSLRSGRGMSMADLDNDGRVDIVVNNLNSPAQLFENRLCGGKGIEAELRWPGSKNSRAVGAQIVLHTSKGPQWREVTSVSGYLSGDAPRIHFGFPVAERLERAWLEVLWPDGRHSTVKGLKPQTLLTLTRQEG
jgi:hypothetical protein